jgi:hypothetical protein
MARTIRLGLFLAVVMAPLSGARGDDPVRRTRAVRQPNATRPPTLVIVAPGTRLGDGLPAGWNHLVIKSVPTLVSGDIATLPRVAKSTATKFRSVLLADVRKNNAPGAGYELRRVGVGLCMPVRGVDTAITSSSLDALHVSLGFVDRQVLRRAEEETARGRIRGRTPTFALYSAPVTLKVGRSHVPVVLRYALLVDRDTGALRTLLWPLREDPATRKPPRAVLALAPGLNYRCGLDVQAERLLGAIPANWSFAMAALPPGEAVGISSTLQALAVRERLTPAESAEFEAELRRNPSLVPSNDSRPLVTGDASAPSGVRVGRAN